MRLSIDSLLSDIEEYLVENAEPYPQRYKRLDPRGLLGRAYTVIAELDEKIVSYEAPDEYDEEDYGEYEDEEYDEEAEEAEDDEAVDNVDDVK